MSLGFGKDLSRTIVAAVSQNEVPLPDDLIQLIHAYIDKHTEHDEAYYNKLLEELLVVYQWNIHGKPGRFAPFLAILRELNPLVVGSGRLLWWWERFSSLMLGQLAEEKGFASDARKTVLEWLLWDGEEGTEQEAHVVSVKVVHNIVGIWMEKWHASNVELDDEAKFVEHQLQLILIAFGRKRPQDFLNTIDRYFVKKEGRIGALTLLCEFVRHQPPHLYQVPQIDLFDHLLRCLQTDTSTRVISLAITALIMFLPHVPDNLPPHLPALFNIYTRMLFWDREKTLELNMAGKSNTTSQVSSVTSDEKKTWAKLSYQLESEDETVPELLHYFTFLYGLYPINFMNYIRKPQRYLRLANFPAADDIDIEPEEVHQRSERYRAVHLLHPNMFTMTLETELSDMNRWTQSEAADVVAECMGLYNPLEDRSQDIVSRASASPNAVRPEPNLDVPEEALLGQTEQMPSQVHRENWRHTGSTAVASPDEERTIPPFRNPSQSRDSLTSTTDSPSTKSEERRDSPTLPPIISPSASQTRLDAVLKWNRPSRTSANRQSNESTHSLTLPHHPGPSTSADNNLASLSRSTPHSPSLSHAYSSPLDINPATRIAHLQRDTNLLRADLNFERYLKNQHLSHISKLRRKQIQEARVEAETQDLLNANRALRSKLDESRRVNLQLRKENEKSRANSRNWETSLTTKLKALKEKSKQWDIEGEALRRELAGVKDEHLTLRKLVVEAEQKELAAVQRMKDMERGVKDVEGLRMEITKLKAELMAFEEHEETRGLNRQREEWKDNEIHMLNLKLAANDTELEKMRKSCEESLSAAASVQSETTLGANYRDGGDQARRKMLEAGLTASNNRIAEVQKAHSHLMKRYSALESKHFTLMEMWQKSQGRSVVQDQESEDENDQFLLSKGGIVGTELATREASRSGNTKSSSPMEAEKFDGVYNATTPLEALGREDFSVHKERNRVVTAEAKGKSEERNTIGGLHFHGFGKLGGGGAKSSSSATADQDGESEAGEGTRFTRALQSPTRKEKDASKKEKKKSRDKTREDKKSGGSRLLTGF